MNSLTSKISLRRPISTGTTPNIFMGVALQVARKLLFIDTYKKAIFFMGLVILLSIIRSFITLDDSYYIFQKHSIFNQYGVKLGWFWTCVLLGPFIWFSSKSHYKDKDKCVIDLMRLIVATICWYFSVWQFHRILAWTSHCDLNVYLSYSQCREQGGIWIAGLDISGHCFLILYSILVMSEEVNAFRQWNQITLDDRSELARQRHEKNTRIVQYLFLSILLLNIFWFKQMVISVLYYHIFIDKVIGAFVAIFWWYVTYHVLYPAGFLQSPICRHKVHT